MSQKIRTRHLYLLAVIASWRWVDIYSLTINYNNIRYIFNFVWSSPNWKELTFPIKLKTDLMHFFCCVIGSCTTKIWIRVNCIFRIRLIAHFARNFVLSVLLALDRCGEHTDFWSIQFFLIITRKYFIDWYSLQVNTTNFGPCNLFPIITRKYSIDNILKNVLCSNWKVRKCIVNHLEHFIPTWVLRFFFHIYFLLVTTKMIYKS